MNRFEIEIRDGCWTAVTRLVFRSWCGRRRLNGHPYKGPRFIYLTNELIPTTQRTED